MPENPQPASAFPVPGTGDRKDRTLSPVLPILFLALAASLPMLIYGMPNGHDAVNHVLWHDAFTRQLFSGDLYPRWLMDGFMGMGSPVFFFYAPVPYYIGAVVRAVTFGIFSPWRELGIACFLSVLVSGLSAYGWLSCRIPRRFALWGALFYMLMPYHLLVNTYVRAAYAECWAMAFAPLVLLLAERAGKGSGRAVAGLAVSYALLIMTHLPTTLIFSLIPVLWAALCAFRAKQRAVFFRVVAGMAAGVLLSGIYLVPAMTLQETVYVPLMSTSYFHFSRNFLFSNADNVPFYITHREFMGRVAVHLAVALVPAIFCAAFWHKREKKGSGVFFFAIAAAIFVFMMLPPSRPVWDLLPPLQKIQFPWRFQTVLCIAGAFLLAWGAAALSHRFPGSRLAGFVAPLLVLAFLAAPDAAPNLLRMPDPLLWFGSGISPRNLQEMKEASSAREYLPRTSNAKFLTRPRKTRVRIASGEAKVEVKQWRPRKILLAVETSKGADIWVGQYYYPGWRAVILEERRVIPVNPASEMGVVGLKLPPGKYTVSLFLAPNRFEQTGWRVSLLGLAALFAIFVFRTGKKRSNTPRF